MLVRSMEKLPSQHTWVRPHSGLERVRNRAIPILIHTPASVLPCGLKGLPLELLFYVKTLLFQKPAEVNTSHR